MILIILIHPNQRAVIRAVATLITGLVFLISVRLLLAFHPEGGMQFVERVQWIPQLNVFYHLGVDGVSLVMVIATTLLHRERGAEFLAGRGYRQRFH